VPCVQILMKKSVPRAVIAAAAGPLKSGNQSCSMFSGFRLGQPSLTWSE
jgi:hypothetical protein